MQARRDVRTMAVAVMAIAALVAAALVVRSAPADAQTAKPVIYVTFDDGPSENGVTDDIVSVLAANNAKATFFVLGEQVALNPARLQATVAAGHAIGNHGWDHENLTTLTAPQVAQQFDDTQNAVTAAGGPAMTCYRPPFAARNAIVDAAATARNLDLVLWTADSQDYLDPKPTAAQMVANIVANLDVNATAADPPQTVIFHDGYANQAATVAGVTLFLSQFGNTFDFEAHPDCATSSNPVPPVNTAPWPVTGCVYATPSHPPTGFVDVAAGQFYTGPVAWAKASNITTGLTATTFGPSEMVTRAQMAAFLHRMVCNQGGSPNAGFNDVAVGQFYSNAVDWLKAEGITTGTSATTYSPSVTVDRAQMAAFLWRMAGSPTGSPNAGFSDVPQGQFYTEAVNWLKAEGITTGTTATTYEPNQVVTRAQMATFLFRLAN